MAGSRTADDVSAAVPTLETVPEHDVRRSRAITLTGDGVRRGLRASVAVALGPLVWGISFGVIAIEAGFGTIGATIMSLVVYSGSAQMVAMDMVQRDAGIVAILVSTFLVSLRYILMGMTMSGWFRSTPRWLFLPGIHYLSDQSWAMTINELREKRRDIGYFFGLNIGMVVSWVAGSALGALAGGWLAGSIDGLYFASTAALVGILAEMKVRRQDVLPWIVAAIAAIGAHELFGGSWYVFIGIGAGLAVALVTGDDDADR